MNTKRRALFTLLLFAAAVAATRGEGPATIDESFATIDLRLANGRQDLSYVSAVVVQSDQRILVAGYFGWVNGQSRHGIVRLLPDGQVDSSFVPGTTTNAGITRMVLQPDGKIIVNGGVANPNTWSGRASVARLNADGSVDTSFIQTTDRVRIEDLELGSDGKIYVGGAFQEIQGFRQHYLARLHPSGRFDESFRPPTVYMGIMESGIVRVAVQPDQKVLIAGMFLTEPRVSGTLARFNEDGELDSSFTNETVVPYYCGDLLVQPDGKILHAYREDPRYPRTSAVVNRYLPDRTVDPTFQKTTNVPGQFNCMALQRDGKILAGGHFDDDVFYLAEPIVRLNADGSWDQTFKFSQGFKRYPLSVAAIAIQDDGKILIGGAFYSTDSVRMNLIRVRGDAAYLMETRVRETGDLVVRWSINDTTKRYGVEVSDDLKNWAAEPAAKIGEKAVEISRAINDGDRRFLRLTVSEETALVRGAD
jgi:uncharacterized delta-60 repeat protein